MPGLEDTVHIDVSSIPSSVFDCGCRVLATSIRRALSDPEKRKEFEEWKKKKAAEAAKK